MIRKREFILMGVIIFGALGMLLNFNAEKNNDCRMPVLTDGSFYLDNPTHFTFRYLEDVRLPYITDILRVNKVFFSIGDILLVLAMIGIFVYLGIAMRDEGTKGTKPYPSGQNDSSESPNKLAQT